MATNIDPIQSAPIPEYSLHDSGSVALASLLGSPVAGGTLMAINYRRIGLRGKAVGAFAIGLGLTVLCVLLGYFIPSGGSTGVAIGLVFGMRQLAKQQQGAAVDQHIIQGGPVASKWGAVGVGMAWLTVLVAGILAVAFGVETLTSAKLVIGSKDNIIYSGSSTKQDAQALGDALKADGYFTDRGASVLLEKGKSGTTVSFVVREGFWDNPDNVTAFGEVARQVAPSIGGLPLTVRLVDSKLEVKKEVAVK